MESKITNKPRAITHNPSIYQLVPRPLREYIGVRNTLSISHSRLLVRLRVPRRSAAGCTFFVLLHSRQLFTCGTDVDYKLLVSGSLTNLGSSFAKNIYDTTVLKGFHTMAGVSHSVATRNDMILTALPMVQVDNNRQHTQRI